MIYIVMPSSAEHRRLPFYLAMEEWVARNLPAEDYFFTWIVDPTVICGRNQDLMAEVDMEYCREKGIDVCRRRSGGGCVYADRDNIMISYVTPSTEVEGTFARYSALVVGALKSLGLNACASGRNDILIDGRKVSGGAFYRMPGRSVAHSTMLFSTNMENMLRAITPSRAKLESKKVQSVVSRITTVSEHLPSMAIEEFRDRLISHLSDGSISLTQAQIEEVEAIEKRYYHPEWLEGRRLQRGSGAERQSELRIEGVGIIAIELMADHDNRIIDVGLSGDFFSTDAVGAIISALKGVRLEQSDVARALQGIDVSGIIYGLTNDMLAEAVCTAE